MKYLQPVESMEQESVHLSCPKDLNREEGGGGMVRRGKTCEFTYRVCVRENVYACV